MNHFFDHSNRAKELVETGGKSDLWAFIEERFNSCPEGKSFSVPGEKVPSDSAIRSLVSRRAKQASKIFRVIKHPGAGETVYEIARFPDQRKVIGQPIGDEQRGQWGQGSEEVDHGEA